CLQGYSNPYSF
nr:immunoglobulin light chain junction region [Macaca mulatta]MOX88591.1 immunoglobulin light chain junction region [Macaca mulatta]MOX88748.1 immunoglobulin light chain junction region [Macaca mulatta]MOX90160.1 immunoglobulin light chain junction region [Macaca mulatta]MOX90251.1 immunoglobulin light chain junction region [Macaca mulatta]